MWPNELSKPWPLGIVSFVKPRCHLPTCPVIYPPAFIISANVTCVAGIPAFYALFPFHPLRKKKQGHGATTAPCSCCDDLYFWQL